MGIAAEPPQSTACPENPRAISGAADSVSACHTPVRGFCSRSVRREQSVVGAPGVEISACQGSLGRAAPCLGLRTGRLRGAHIEAIERPGGLVGTGQRKRGRPSAGIFSRLRELRAQHGICVFARRIGKIRLRGGVSGGWISLRRFRERNLLRTLHSALASRGQFFVLILREPFRPLLKQYLMFFSGIGIGIQLWKKVPISLHQCRGNRPKLNVRFQPREDALVGQVRIGYHLPVVGRIPGNPMFQLDHQPRIFGSGPP